MKKIVIIGSSIAGVSAAEAAKKADPSAAVSIYSKDTFLPYYRLRIGEVLVNPAAREGLTLHPESWYEAKGIRLHLGKEVSAIDVDAKILTLNDQTTVPYDRLILAQGSHSFVPPIPGADLDGVKTLWTMADALAIESALQPGRSCVIIGAGLLGLETAYQVAGRGLDTTVLNNSSRLLSRQLDETGSALFKKQVEKQAIRPLVNAQTSAIQADASRTKVASVLLEDGRSLPADIVIISAGVRPNLALLEGTGIATNRFVITNDRMETNIPDVYAAGDVMEQDGGWFGQWSISMAQGKTAGTNAARGSAEYKLTPPPYTMNTMGTKVAAGGQVTDNGEPGYRESVSVDEERLHYRKVCYLGETVCGFILIGDTKEFVTLSRRMNEG